MKKLFTLFTLALLVATPIVADNVKTLSFDFEDGNKVFTDDSRITSSIIEENSSKVLNFVCAKNAQNGYSFSHYDFSEFVSAKTYKVEIELDYYNTNGGRAILSFGDASVRGKTGNSTKTTYSNKGAIFAIGSNKTNSLIQGTSKALNTFTNKWMHLKVVVDITTKKVSYIVKEGDTELLNVVDASFYNTEANTCSQIDLFGYINSSKCAKLDNINIKIYNIEAQTAKYTISYQDLGGNEIKEKETFEGVVGTTPSITDNNKKAIYANGNKYIYASDDASTKTISDDGTTVVTVNFREAATYSYSLVSDKGAVLNSGSNFEGETLPIGFPRYYFNKSDSTLYEAQGLGGKKNEYYKSITLDANDKQETIAYNKGTKNRIAFYTEGEDIAGAVTTTSWNNVAVRASNALAATTTEDLYITSLPAGKYKIHVGCFTDGKGQTIKLALGDRILNFFVPAGNNFVNLYEVASQEIAISKTTQLLLLADGLNTNKNLLDYLYVEKTGHMDESKYGEWMESEGSDYDPENGLAPSEDGKFPGSIESPVRPENGLITFPEDNSENEDAVGAVTGIDSVSSSAKVVAIFTANGKRVNALQKGLNILKLSDGSRIKVLK